MANVETISVTAKEASALHGIQKSEYNDGSGRGIWVFSIEASTKGKALGGVLASLAKKGLLELDSDARPNFEAGEDAYVNLTETGLAFLAGRPGFVTVAERASKTIPTAEPTTAAETTAEPAESTAPASSPSVRPQTEKLRALNLAMCSKGRLFGAKASCKCCGATLAPAIEMPAKKSRSRKAAWDAATPATSDAARAKNADAKAARAAKRAGIATASVGSGS